MNPAPNLVLVGPMGAGKSTVGRLLAERFGLRFLDLDAEIEARCGVDIARIFECEGEPGFRRRERALLAELLDARACVLATGGGAVLDVENRRLMRERGFVVYLQVDIATQRTRLARDHTRPLLAAGDRDGVLARLARERGPLYMDVADLVFSAADAGVADTVTALAAQIDRAWRREDSDRRRTTA